MKTLFYGFVLGLLMLGGDIRRAVADELLLKDSYPERYVVVKGDTLWDIAGQFLRNPWMWPEIWQVNPQIDNPHLIYPGDVISLVYMDGKPRLTVQRTTRVSPNAVKLSPKIIDLGYDTAIPAIPLEKVNTYLSRSRILETDELELAPYVVAGAQNRLIVGAGDRVYARGDFTRAEPVYGFYRRGDTFVDPDTGEILGYQAIDIGSGRVKALESDIATLAVNRTTREIRVGDRLLKQIERVIASSFYPSAPKQPIDGVILAVEDGVTQVGAMDVVILNRGLREGLQVGHVLAIFKRGEQIRDRVSGDTVVLPDERAGLMMVFKSFDKMSLALVLEADRALAVNDVVRNP